MKSFFHFDVADLFSHEPVELANDKATLRELLEEVMQRGNGRIRVIDPETGKIDVDYFILVNGHDAMALPKELDTRLRDGDEVGIGMMYHWGGG